jgi:transcription elongation factor GreA
MTKRSFEQLKVELQRLKAVERPKVIKAIEEARGHGDLSENAEYDAAKQKQGILEARIAQLEHKIASAQVIDPSTIQETKITFGATVTVINLDTEEERTYMIVGEDEADLKAGKISILSPMARALIGKQVKDIVEFDAPGGRRELEIMDIQYR